MKKHQIYIDQKKHGFFGFPNAVNIALNLAIALEYFLTQVS